MKRNACALTVTLGIAVLSVMGMAAAQEPIHEPLPIDALASFLVEAKVNGYASDVDSQVRKLKDGGSEVSSGRGEFSYRDRWYGGIRFSGEEVVWHKGRPVWSMNFYGANRQGANVPAEFTKFHKAALRRVDTNAPFRGPALHLEGDFVYFNVVTGSLEEFRGTERIFFRDEEIYRLEYHGGLIDR